MRLYHALAIGSWFIFINQGSAVKSGDVCSEITTIIVVNGTSRILKISVNDNTITPTNNCSCEIMTYQPAMYLCLSNQNASCASCCSDECLSSDVDSSYKKTCISISLNPIYAQASDGNDSCPTSTNLTINLSMNSSSDCSGMSKGNTFYLFAFDSCLQHKESRREFLNATCNARSATTDESSTTATSRSTTDALRTTIWPTSSAWNSWPTSATTTTVATRTTSRSWQTTGWNSTTRRNTTPSSTSLASPDQTTSSQSSLTTEMIIGIGVGIGVACGVLLIIAIIVVFSIRKRRAGYNKHHITNPSQTTAADPSQNPYTSFTNPDSAAYDNATTDTALNYQLVEDTSFTNPDSASYDNATTDTASSYQLVADTSYTDPSSAAYDNATTVTELSYPIAANDHKTVGEANYEYIEVKQPEAISSPDDSTTEIGRNEAYSTINAMGNNYDNVNENTSTKIEPEMTLIDNELYG